ncbi:RluA family pseudouridine synthase [Virgibacillus sp. W0181]|uniref:RluA family pseudouridine synthase n=1 Tax=Virgibacillus sp. W0181 TaxID=3391581 RepID=UPI003F485AD3
MKIPILYEDNHLLIVDKPINIPVQEDRSGDDDLLSLLKKDIKIRYKKPGNVYLGLVHRLDRPVSGVMVFAKTSKAASRLSDMIRRQVFYRTYIAAVKGKPRNISGSLEHYLFKNHRNNKVAVVSPSNKKAKKALLEYEIIGETESFSLLKIQLQTGRPHQIRVQLAAIGCPIIGDHKYGEGNRIGQSIALRAATLEFKHPTKDETIKIESQLPNQYPWTLWKKHHTN